MQILGISGSLRQDSCNTQLLKTAAAMLPSAWSMRITGCAGIPLYDAALDGESKPEAVMRLKEAIAAADGLLIATPEYNYSLSGVLKNAIDWVSRPAYRSVLAGKPAAIVSAAASHVGGGRAQSHLRDILSATLTPVVPAIPFLLPMAPSQFSADGSLKDGDTARRLQQYLLEFTVWIERLR